MSSRPRCAGTAASSVVRITPILLAIATLGLAAPACGSGESGPYALPRLDAGFTALQTVENLTNRNVTGFGIDVMGAAMRGDRIAVITRVSFNADATGGSTATVFYDPVTDSLQTQASGATYSSSHTLFISEDRGEHWQRRPLAPANASAPVDLMYGVVLLDDRILSTVLRSPGRALVEIDPETGTYERLLPTADVSAPDVGFYNAYLHDDTIWTIDVVADLNQVGAWRVNLQTLEKQTYSYFGLPCKPATGFYSAGGLAHPTSPFEVPDLVSSSPGHFEGLCTDPQDRVCHWRWSPSDAAPDDTPPTVGLCVDSDELFEVATRGEVDVRETAMLPWRGHLLVYANLLHRPDADTVVPRSVVVDFGPSEVAVHDLEGVQVGANHALALVRQFAAPVVPGHPACDLATSTGWCLEPADGPREKSELWGPLSEAGGGFGAWSSLALPCDGLECSTVPAALATVPSDRSKLFGLWEVRKIRYDGISAFGRVELAVGFVDHPWYAAPPDGSPPAGIAPASALERLCWAEATCRDQPAELAPEERGLQARLQQEECVRRWMSIDTAASAFDAFLATPIDDCGALEQADPLGFLSLEEACLGSGQPCVAGGRVACAQNPFGGPFAAPTMRDCAVGGDQASCNVDRFGIIGCGTSVCAPEDYAGAHCDAQGRAIHCNQGYVEDCPARGLECVASVDQQTSLAFAWCAVPGATPEDTCVGDIQYDYFGYQAAYIGSHCGRVGLGCSQGRCGGGDTDTDFTGVGCRGDWLVQLMPWGKRATDCRAFGAHCRQGTGNAALWCEATPR
ncbi:MAG: hypothetical protein H6744_05685 [Deltaproteobacteria bacterium]|nr:hypothetical protein [Deltaproteobacteria bacterium]MCB9786171.1 hypothetical protein [Deltaproteobacteria bacterium]